MQQLDELIQARNGHFLLESGHHGELWLDLELLCLDPNRLQPFASELARRLVEFDLDAICGPLVEGAFVALMVARKLGVNFFYSEPIRQTESCDLYGMAYRLPAAQRQLIKKKRVAIVNDVINAGSAVRGTYIDLQACQAKTIALASLLALGDTPKELAEQWNIDLITIDARPNSIWRRDECPMCANRIPLDNA